jgi:hypothetical protein
VWKGKDIVSLKVLHVMGLDMQRKKRSFWLEMYQERSYRVSA